MAHAWSLSRRSAFIIFLAPLILAAQETTKWDQDFQNGAKAFRAGHYDQAIDSLSAALEDAQAFPPLDLRRADAAHYALLVTNSILCCEVSFQRRQRHS